MAVLKVHACFNKEFGKMNSLDSIIRDIIREEIKTINPKLEAIVAKIEENALNITHKEKKYLLRQKDVTAMVGFKATTLYNLIREGKFPAPLKMGTISLWSVEDIDNWFRDFKNQSRSESK
jgi:prophage regulatory protein